MSSKLLFCLKAEFFAEWTKDGVIIGVKALKVTDISRKALQTYITSVTNDIKLFEGIMDSF
jgi:hypothetical protein